MKKMRTITTIILITTLLFSGVYATGGRALSELESLEQEINALEETLAEKYEQYDDLLNEEGYEETDTYCDDLDQDCDEDIFSFESEMTFLEELDLDESVLQTLETLFNEAMALENEGSYDLADDKWDAYFDLIDPYYETSYDETSYDVMTFENILEELEAEGIELSEEEQSELEALYDAALELEATEAFDQANDVWDEFDELLYELTDWEEEEPITLSAVYLVKDGKLVLSVDPEDYPDGEAPQDLSKDMKVLHQKLWSRTNALIPTDYLKYFKKLEIGTDGEEGILASVVELEDLSKWAMFLDTKDAFTNEKAFKSDFDFTVIHELGHVITLNSTQLSQAEQTGTYSTMEGHALKESYINAFYQMFWQDQNTSEEDAYERYDENPNAFVSDYAATNVEEDMAESFAQFVTGDKASGQTLADQKINFFYNYPELIKVRDDIRNQL